MLESLATKALYGWTSNSNISTMAKAAASGVRYGNTGIGMYDQLDPTMVVGPRNVLKAYEQAVYFVSVATLRALDEGERGAARYLQTVLGELQDDAAETYEKVNWVCSTFGVACPTSGSTEVLDRAITAVRMSGLNADDANMIERIIGSNKTSFYLRQAIPVIATVGAGAVLGTLLYRWASRA